MTRDPKKCAPDSVIDETNKKLDSKAKHENAKKGCKTTGPIPIAYEKLKVKIDAASKECDVSIVDTPMADGSNDK